MMGREGGIGPVTRGGRVPAPVTAEPKAYDLVLWLVLRVNKFPRDSHRTLRMWRPACRPAGHARVGLR